MQTPGKFFKRRSKMKHHKIYVRANDTLEIVYPDGSSTVYKYIEEETKNEEDYVISPGPTEFKWMCPFPNDNEE